MFTFGRRRSKRFLILLLVIFAIPMLALLPFTAVKLFLFLPLLLWINIVGMPLAMIGTPYFEIHEFGAVPQGVTGYALIALVYVVAAFFLSMIGRKDS